jgi:hypothetical protein
LGVTVDATDIGNIAFLGAKVTFDTVTAAGAAFIGNGSAVALTPGESGNVYLRPNGASNASGQTAIAPTGAMSVSGAFSCVTFNASGSDIRIKTNVRGAVPRPLHRLLSVTQYGPLAIYTHLADGKEHTGPIAQDVQAVAPAFVGTFPIEDGAFETIPAGMYLNVDKESMAYEQAMWSGAEIDRLHDIIAALQERLLHLESR